MERRADILVLAAAMIWALGYLAQKTAMTEIGPLTFVACRTSVAAVVLWPFARREGGALPLPWRWIGFGGLAYFLAAAVQQAGMVTASVINTAFLTALYIVLVPLLALVVLGRRSGARLWVAAALALAGTYAMSDGRLDSFGAGDWMVLASSVGWAAYMLVTEAASRAARPLGYTAGVFAVVALLAWALALAVETPTPAALVPALGEILYVGVMSSALTFGIMAIALRHIPAPRAAVLLSAEAPFAALIAAVALNERLTPVAWTGAAMIVAAVLVVQVRRG